MSAYGEDRAWSDVHLPQIQSAIRYWMGVEAVVAPNLEDIKRNTDMIILDANGSRVACRIRRNRYYLRYPHQFTLRHNRASGAETELSKLLKGFGDFVFYGFADKAGTRLASAFMGDLAAFRSWYMPHYGELLDNGDGTGFIAYDKRFIPGFVVHEYTKPTQQKTEVTK